MWNVCGAQYRYVTAGELMPRTMSAATLPSSTKSSGWGSRRSWIPSRSKIGSSSSIDRQNIASDRLACSGRPLNSEFITVTPSSTAISIDRFQYRTAASRSSSSGPDQRNSGSSDDTSTPAASSALRKALIVAASTRGCLKNGMKSSRGDSSMCS